MTFFHKLILAAVAGAMFAGLIEFYRNVIEAGDRAVNGRFRDRAAQLEKDRPAGVAR